jgi:aminoglycoside/choline kinase family phosphotransferase
LTAVRVAARSGQTVDVGRQREVAAVIGELFECPVTSVRVGERLAHAVTRVYLENASLIVKRLEPAAARLNEQVATRWLPAVGLEGLAVKPLATKADADGTRTWLVYEDLGDSTLATYPEQAEAAVEAIAQLHARLAGHYLLAECRLAGHSKGSEFHASSLDDAVNALRALRPETQKRARLRRSLLEFLAAPARVVDAPETLLHGDLWATNILPGPKLIDWDKAGVGPLTYDLGTLLAQFPGERRERLLALYLESVSSLGWKPPSRDELNGVFEASERARIAQNVIWISLGLLEGNHVDWYWSELARRHRWLEELEPVLP